MTFKKKSYETIVEDILADLTGADSPFTDRNIGSVTLTLVEAFSREVATLYAQLEKTYLSAYVDTAEGAALDFVVSILGVNRIRAGRPVGVVEFSRNTPAPGDITIPRGTAVSDSNSNRYVTIEEKTLRQGQTAIEVTVRAASEEIQPVDQKALNLMPQPVVGIETVTNREATVRSTEDESDEYLRKRAKTALYGAGKATIDAIRFAVMEQGVESVVIHDMPRGVPGELDVIVDYGVNRNGLEDEVKEAIAATRAAGIWVNLRDSVGVYLTIIIKVTLSAPLQKSEESLLADTIQGSIAAYIKGLKAGEPVLNNKIVALAMADSRVQNVSFAIEVEDAAERIMPNGDVHMGRMEKASLPKNGIMVTFYVAQPVIQPEKMARKPDEESIGPAPVQVEVAITVGLNQDFVAKIGDPTAAEGRVKTIIENRIRAYVTELFAGDAIKYADLLESLESEEKYTISTLKLINTHTRDGLVVTLDTSGRNDWVRKEDQDNPEEIVELIV